MGADVGKIKCDNETVKKQTDDKTPKCGRTAAF